MENLHSLQRIPGNFTNDSLGYSIREALFLRSVRQSLELSLET